MLPSPFKRYKFTKAKTHLFLLTDSILGKKGDIVLSDQEKARNILIPLQLAYYVPRVRGKPLLPPGYKEKEETVQSKRFREKMNDRVNVRERDYDMYLASLFIPNEYRARIWRLQSFYLELDRVSDQDLKFQNLKYSFWINNYKDLLNSTRVKRMVTSFQNKPQNLTTLKELEVEAEATVSQIFYLMLEILNIRDLKIDHGVSHLGQAIGIIKVLQNINGRIPSELLAKFKISSLDIHRKQEITKLQDLAFELGTRANDHLITSLLFQKEWPKKGFPVMLNYVTAKEYLKRLENCDFDLYKLQKNRSWNLPLKLLYYARRGILK